MKIKIDTFPVFLKSKKIIDRNQVLSINKEKDMYKINSYMVIDNTKVIPFYNKDLSEYEFTRLWSKTLIEALNNENSTYSVISEYEFEKSIKDKRDEFFSIPLLDVSKKNKSYKC